MAQIQITKPIRLIELFGGVGSQAMALERMGVPMEHYRLVEFDKYCIQSYNAIHGTDFKPEDITKLHIDDLGITEKNKYTYLITYSFPCQSLSLSGKMAGMSYEDWKNGTKTRSSLLFEVGRILKEGQEKGSLEGDPEKYLPQILLMENVTQVHSKKNLKDFEIWLSILEGLGYQSVYQDMNAKDYGIPQSRNRTFCVSWQKSEYPDGEFHFPEPIPLSYSMEQCLQPEPEIEDKFYVKNDRADQLIDELLDRYGDDLEQYLGGCHEG